MAADVSTIVRAMNGISYRRDDRKVRNDSSSSSSSGVKSTALITRDLLGLGVGGGDSMKNHDHHELQGLDLDSQVPIGWEKRLDLKSGKVYLQRCDASNSQTKNFSYQRPTNQAAPKTTLNLFDDNNLELKLVSSSSSITSSSQSPKSPTTIYQSVCTLDKVKSALERVEREPIVRKRSTLSKSSLSNNSGSSNSKDAQDHDQENDVLSPVAVGCPACLSYVLIMKSNPKCPRCNSLVSIPVSKKPRIDLNISI